MARKNKRRAAEAAPLEVEATDKGGMNIDDGIVLFTAILLACALTCVIMAGGVYQ